MPATVQRTTPAASGTNVPYNLSAAAPAPAPATNPVSSRRAAPTASGARVPYNLSDAAPAPAPAPAAAGYPRRTVPVSNGTHILYNVSVVAADGSPAPLPGGPLQPDQTLYTQQQQQQQPSGPLASNTPLITWITIAGGVVGAALVASSMLLATDLWAGRLPCCCCCRRRRPPPPEAGGRGRDGARELRLPVLVVMPGKEVVVAQRVSMDRSATTGAQLPVVDDYVFHKTSSTADQAGMSAMVEAQLAYWRSEATTLHRNGSQ
ncbi:hypothetical protein WJX81_006861 [Elliptochloris bilobata]|uniref:Uncharacterized protein n=1 Tax=Elliptochloris bilobata TaxID=381761 RepID=A0AAW1R300_9CHLO